LLAVERGAGDSDPTIGVAPHLPDRQTALVRVGNDARTVVRIAWSSHRALIPLGTTSDSGAYASPVIDRIRTSSSVLDRSELAPWTILQQLFTQ
jgi:hypothetical protein